MHFPYKVKTNWCFTPIYRWQIMHLLSAMYDHSVLYKSWKANSIDTSIHVYRRKKEEHTSLPKKKRGTFSSERERDDEINLPRELHSREAQDDPLKMIAAPIPKTPRTPPKERDLSVWLSFSFEMKNWGNTPDDLGWQQNQFKDFALGGTATCKCKITSQDSIPKFSRQLAITCVSN